MSKFSVFIDYKRVYKLLTDLMRLNYIYKDFLKILRVDYNYLPDENKEKTLCEIVLETKDEQSVYKFIHSTPFGTLLNKTYKIKDNSKICGIHKRPANYI